MLKNICCGNNVYYSETLIDDSNRKSFYNILFSLYKKSFYSNKTKQENGIIQAKKSNEYKGRKPIAVDELLFLTILNEFNNGKIKAKEAANKIGISIDKFYRLKKLHK